MCSKILFFILTVLKVNIVCSVLFSSNIDQMMTLEEISDFFGSNDVPSYQVTPMVLPEGTEKADDKIYLIVEINGTEIYLTFEPTARYLATRYTPVWLATTDQKAYNKIRYDPLPNAMADIGAFKMYHDVENDAAIVVYTDSDDEVIIEGIVTSDYVIKSLPKRLLDPIIKVGENHFRKSPWHHKRCIAVAADEVTSYAVLFKSPPPAADANRNVFRQVNKRQLLRWSGGRMSPTTVYPEIMLVLDHNAIRNNTITQALRSVLAFWNGVDMVYSKLENPDVYINIAGIIISADDAATPYIAEDTSIKVKPYCWSIINKFAKYFGKELHRFPLSQYDMIFAMTPIKLCNEGADNCRQLLAFSSFVGACPSEQEVKRLKEIDGVGVLHYNRLFGGVQAAVHESAHQLGVYHDGEARDIYDCNRTDGYVMAPSAEFRHQNFKWSPCSENFFRRFFSSMQSSCLDNTPMSIKPVNEVLPGRWLSLDAQCQNMGFEESCDNPEFPVCMLNSCKREKSQECEISELTPLAGTKCGWNKHCHKFDGCIDD